MYKKMKLRLQKLTAAAMIVLTTMSVLPFEVMANENDTSFTMSINGEEVVLNDDGSFVIETPTTAGDHSAVSSQSTLILPEPHIASMTADGYPTIIVDLEDWNDYVDIERIDLETETTYVSFVSDTDFGAIVFPQGVTPTYNHTFRLIVTLRGHSFPLVIGLNGLAQITYFDPFVSVDPEDEDLFEVGTLPQGVSVAEATETVLRDLLAPYNTPAQVDAAVEQILNPMMGVPPGGIFGPDWDNDLDVWNWPANAIIVRKFNRVTGELLPGARFDLIDISAGQQQPGGTLGTILNTFVTGHSGTVVITGLYPGTYMVVETQAPGNFTLGEHNTRIARMFPDGFSAIALDFYNDPFGALQITLRDSVTSLPLADGVFRVTNAHGQVVGTGNGIFTTNNQGQILIPNLPPAGYVIEQITPPTGYRLGNIQIQTIFVNATGNIYNVDFLNIPPNALTVTLRDTEDLQPLPGGIFRVTESGGALVGTNNGLFTTNAQGQFTVEIQPNTSYIVEQITPAVGHRLVQPVTRTIMTGQTGQNYVLDFTNEPYQGLVIISLDGHNNDPLPGVRYEVRRQDGTIVGEFTSDNNGRIELTAATGHELLGWFEVVQIYVPNGWQFDSQPQRNIQVTTQNNAQMTFNMPRMGSLEITLNSSVSPFGPLAGGMFEVRHQNGTLLGTFTTNAAGGITVPNIGSGWLTIEPLQPPTGFVFDDTLRSVEVQTNTVTRAQFTATPIASLIIELTDPQMQPLQGGVFVVRTVAGAELFRGTTGIGGTISMPAVAAPTVVVEQIQAPSGFVMTTPAQTLDIVQGQTNIVRFVNSPEVILTIEKVDINGNPLMGATFEIRDTEGSLIYRGVTNNGGLLTVSGLLPGTIIVEETIAPDGFIITDPARTITISAGDIITERFVNHRRSLWTVQKIDGNTEAPLQGVVFELRTLAGQQIQNPLTQGFEFTTNAAGQITLPHLYPGTFVLTETRPLQGYMAVEPIVFSVGVNNTYLITVRNYMYPDFNIRKISAATGYGMQGVVFNIAPLFANGTQGAPLRNPIDGSINWTTDINGIIRIPNLEHGTYIVTEISTHPGYRI